MTVNGQRVRVTIGDDRDERRAALRWALQAAGAEVVAEAVTPVDLLRLSLRHQPELVVVHPLIGSRPCDDLVPRLLAGIPGGRVIAGDGGGFHAPSPGVRLHAVPTLAPEAVVALVRRLTWSVPGSRTTAVVGLPPSPFRMAVLSALGCEGVATLEEVPAAPQVHRSVRDLAPDLLVIDLSLPGVGGWGSLQQLSEDHPRCRLVVVSPRAALPFAPLDPGVQTVVEGDVVALRHSVRRLVGVEPAPATSRTTSVEMGAFVASGW